MGTEMSSRQLPRSLADRRLRLDRKRSLPMRGLLRLKDGLESTVAKLSVHGDPPVYDPTLFGWTAALERDWAKIRAEVDALMPHRDAMPNFQDILKPVAAINQDTQWKTFWLAGIGMDCAANRERCPETARLIDRIPGLKTAFFSILSPGKHIPAHRGAYNGLLRYHLGLVVPQDKQACRIRIGDTICHWDEGKSLIFDDTFNHEVWNDTEDYRVVLFVDFTRPLRQPFHRLNEAFLGMGAVAPFLREAGGRQKRWERKFYKK